MFPPVEESVLKNNPKFAALHKTLTTRLLNPDGSSKDPAAADREAQAEALQTHLIRANKTELICEGLKTLPITKQTPALPPELIELIILLSLQLSSNLPSASLSLLSSSPAYQELEAQMPQISILLSAHLHKQALALTRLLHPTTNASYLHRTIPKIPAAVQDLLAAIAAKKAALEAARLALVPLSARVLEAYRALVELIIRILEQYKHGQLARSVKLRSEMLAKEAKQEELNARILYGTAQSLVYTPEVNRALTNYMAHLRDSRSRLKQRQKDAEKELERYGVGREGKEKVMKEIARVYAELQKQIQDVRKDVERLKTG